MDDDTISIIAPLLSAGIGVEDALERGRAENSFAVVEEVQGKFRLHWVDVLAGATRSGERGGRLGGLHAEELPMLSLQRAEGTDADDSRALVRQGVDLAIREIVEAGRGGRAVRIVGLARPGSVLAFIVTGRWYQCGTSGCADKTKYTGPGTCAYNHTLVKKP